MYCCCRDSHRRTLWQVGYGGNLKFSVLLFLWSKFYLEHRVCRYRYYQHFYVQTNKHNCYGLYKISFISKSLILPKIRHLNIFRDQLFLCWPSDLEVRGHPFMTSTRKSGFLTPSPVHMHPNELDPLPLVEVHMPSTWNTHNSLETASTLTY